MKNLNKVILLLVMLTAASLTPMASGFSVKEQQDRNLKDFNGISVTSGIELYLTAGQEESVRIEASDEIINDVGTEVRNNTLHIYMKKRNWLNFFNWRKIGTIRAYVTVTSLNNLKVSSGAKARTETTLDGNSLGIDASSGADLILDLIYRDLKVDSSSGSNIRISGRCKNLETNSSSGSIIDARKMEALNCVADVSSGANISLSVTGELRARASSGGNIRYAGNPNIKDFNSSSGGSVSSL